MRKEARIVRAMLGGRARAKKLSAQRRQEIARLGGLKAAENSRLRRQGLAEAVSAPPTP